MGLRRLEVLSLVAVVALVLSFFSSKPSRTAEAHSNDLGFKWFNNGYNYENVNVSGVSWTWDVSSGVWDWYWNSDLYVNTASGFYEVDYSEGNYGNTGWLGAALVYSNTYACMSLSIPPPGGCSKVWPDQATTAEILLNTNDGSAWALANRGIAARHELGHVFGLRHYSEATNACEGILMNNGTCGPGSDPHVATVQPHDAELVDYLYP